MRRACWLSFLTFAGIACSSTVGDPPGDAGDGAGGAHGTGGSPAAGGASGTGGARGMGGATGTGGMSGTGGMPGAGGGNASAHNPLSQTLIDQFVAAHNQARGGPLNPAPAPALPPVAWDPMLADSAYTYLLKCASTGHDLVDHNANRTPDYAAHGGSGYVGENIYASTGTATPAAAVASWMAEAPQFNYATSTIGTAGHYTQVVWRTSVRIGCAIVDCPALTFRDSVLCDYAPGGNIGNQRPY